MQAGAPRKKSETLFHRSRASPQTTASGQEDMSSVLAFTASAILWMRSLFVMITNFQG